MAAWLLIFSVNTPSEFTDNLCLQLLFSTVSSPVFLCFPVSSVFKKKVRWLFLIILCNPFHLCGVAVDAMKLPFLNAYLDSIGMPSFQKGCNFAAAGSTIHQATPTSVCPFSFDIQVNQFLHFKARVVDLLAKGELMIR